MSGALPQGDSTVVSGPKMKTVESLGKKYEVPVDEKGELVVGTATPLPPAPVEQAPLPAQPDVQSPKTGPKHSIMSFPHPITGKTTSLGQILFDIVAERERAKQIVHDGELAFEARFKKYERLLDDIVKAIDKRNDDVGTIITTRCETMNKSIREHIASQIAAAKIEFVKDRERAQEAAKRVEASCATVSAFNGKYNFLDNTLKRIDEVIKLTPQLVDERIAEKLKSVNIQIDRLDKGKVDKRKG